MSWYLTVASAAAFLLAPAGTLVRLETDDTIYILNGEQADLETFDAEVSSTWTGGVLIEKDPSNGKYAYWAFADRTAQESRAFMIPAIVSGLALDIAAYDQAEAFPEQRAALDEVALSCGAEEDPFFLTPLRRVRILLDESDDATARACFLQGLRDSEFRDMIENDSRNNDPATGEEFTQADAIAITEECDAPNDILWVEADGGVRFEPPVNLPYDASACVLKGIKDAGVTKIGFIGNEKLAEPEGE